MTVRLGDLSQSALMDLAAKGQLRYAVGPFTVSLQTRLSGLLRIVSQFYSTIPLLPPHTFCQYHIVINERGLRRLSWRRQAVFSIDGIKLFEPYPLDHAFPLLEWGLNWCIGSMANNYLLLHSAVVERNDCALVLPALPGSGKSTLCAGLINRGWRLLSDEFGIFRHRDSMLVPMPRAMPLKNESIEVIRQFAPDALMGPLYTKTRKGNVKHLAPSKTCLDNQHRCVKPRWVLFPKYIPDENTSLQPQQQSVAFTRLSNNSFNYHVTGEQGFQSLAELVRNVDSYQFVYSDLEDATCFLTDLADR